MSAKFVRFGCIAAGKYVFSAPGVSAKTSCFDRAARSSAAFESARNLEARSSAALESARCCARAACGSCDTWVLERTDGLKAKVVNVL